jgi:hypothetical protein
MDVQGYEDKVIHDGSLLINRAKILLIKTSFNPLYLEQPLFRDIYECLRDDFNYMGSLQQSQTISRIEGSILQEDSIFMRKPIRILI